VIEGFVSREKARAEYGVVLEATRLDIDVKETQRLRDEMRASSPALS
jgi:hypothetical protein